MTRLIRILIIITALMILNSCTDVQPICYFRAYDGFIPSCKRY